MKTKLIASAALLVLFSGACGTQGSASQATDGACAPPTEAPPVPVREITEFGQSITTQPGFNPLAEVVPLAPSDSLDAFVSDKGSVPGKSVVSDLKAVATLSQRAENTVGAEQMTVFYSAGSALTPREGGLAKFFRDGGAVYEQLSLDEGAQDVGTYYVKQFPEANNPIKVGTAVAALAHADPIDDLGTRPYVVQWTGRDGIARSVGTAVSATKAVTIARTLECAAAAD